MKRIKIMFVALATIVGTGGALVHASAPPPTKYVMDNTQTGGVLLTDLTASEFAAGFHCEPVEEEITCSYTDPNLPSARIDKGVWTYDPQ